MNEKSQYYIKPKKKSFRFSDFIRMAGLLAICAVIFSPIGIVWYIFGGWAAAVLGIFYLTAFWGRGRLKPDALNQSMVDPGLEGLPYNIHHKD